jgi:hypothetical protein
MGIFFGSRPSRKHWGLLLASMCFALQAHFILRHMNHFWVN